jgi:large repetitive protein
MNLPKNGSVLKMNQQSYSIAFASDTATLNLSQATASLSQWQSLLRVLGIQNTAAQPTAGVRTLSIDALDASGVSLVNGVSVLNLQVIPPPLVSITSDQRTLIAGQTATITFTFAQDPGNSFTASDITTTGGTLGALSDKLGDGSAQNPWRHTATFTPAAFSGLAGAITVATASYFNPDGLFNTQASTLPGGLTIDTMAPTVLLSFLAGSELVLEMSETMDAASTPLSSRWVLSAPGAGGLDLGNSTFLVSSNMVRISLTVEQRSEALAHLANNALTLTYTDPVGNDASGVLQDVLGNDAASFSISSWLQPSLDMNTAQPEFSDNRGLLAQRLTRAVQVSSAANNQWVTLPANVAISGDYSLEAWVRPTALTSSQQTIVEMGNSDNAYNIRLVLMDNGGGNAGKLGLQVFNSGGSRIFEGLSNAAQLSANVWRHVAASVDSSGAVTLYVDGVSVPLTTTVNTGGTGALAPNNLRNSNFVGRSNFGNPFGGEIRDVRVHDSARSPDQVLADLNGAPVNPQDTSLRLAFDLDGRLDGISNVNGSTLNTAATGTYNGAATPNYATATVRNPTVSLDNPDAPATLTMPTGVSPAKLRLSISGMQDGASERLLSEVANSPGVDLHAASTGTLRVAGIDWNYAVTSPEAGMAHVEFSKAGASIDHFQGLLRSLGYQNNANMPTEGTRQLVLDVQDAAGQSMLGATSTLSLQVSAPPVISIASDRTTLKAGETATITFSFSQDPGSSFTLDDVSVTGGTLDGLGSKLGTGGVGDLYRYTATFTPTANSTQAGALGVAVGKVSNSSSVVNALAAQSPSMAIDTAVPTVSGTNSFTAVLDTAVALPDLVFGNAGVAEVLTLSLLFEGGTVGGLTDADANTPGLQVSGTAAALQTAFAAATFTATTESPTLSLTLSDPAGNISTVFAFSMI